MSSHKRALGPKPSSIKPSLGCPLGLLYWWVYRLGSVTCRWPRGCRGPNGSFHTAKNKQATVAPSRLLQGRQGRHQGDSGTPHKLM